MAYNMNLADIKKINKQASKSDNIVLLCLITFKISICHSETSFHTVVVNLKTFLLFFIAGYRI